jgi:hypothetical protein
MEVPMSKSGVNVDNSDPRELPKLDGGVVGVLAGFTPERVPLVEFQGNPVGFPIAARSVVRLERAPVGASILLMFEGGDASRPIVLGALDEQHANVDAEVMAPAGAFEVNADGGRVSVVAQREIVLRVGKASITLTREGKILLRGCYILSRSSGVNRIKGGSVQLN